MAKQDLSVWVPFYSQILKLYPGYAREKIHLPLLFFCSPSERTVFCPMLDFYGKATLSTIFLTAKELIKYQAL